MRFVYGDDVYAIDFSRDRVLVRTWDGYGDENQVLSKYPSTTVNILKLDLKEKGTKNAEVVFSETVGCYHKDKYTEEGGRLAALKALTSGQLLKNGRRTTSRVPPAMKKLIWQAYFKRADPNAPVPTGDMQEMKVPVATEIVKKPYEAQRIRAILDAEYAVVE